MLKRLQHIFNRLWHLVLEAPETWDKIAKEEKDEPQLRTDFFYIPLCLCMIIGFLGTWMMVDLQHAIAAALRDAVALGTAYFIVRWLCRLTLDRQFPKTYNIEDSDKVVCYCYSFIIIVKTFITLIPNSFYLYLIDFFVAYLLWEAARAVFALEGEEQQILVLFFTGIIIFIPLIITALLHIIFLKNIF